MITDAAVYAAEKDEKSENTYIVSRDFAWGYEKEDDESDETLQESDSILAKGMVYQNGLPVKEAETAFPMITQLREGSSLGSKDGDEVYTIDYLTLSDTANMGTGGHNVPLILTDDNKIRKLTPRECFRVQGFPKEFVLPEQSNTRLYKQAGNSVVVPVIKRIADNIASAVKET